MEDIDKENFRKPSGDEGEVVFSQQEEMVATNEDEWLDDMEPYHGARPRMMQDKRPMMDVNQLVDIVLGATVGKIG